MVKEPEGEQGPTHKELAIVFYNAARAEVLQRLALREQVFLAWIGTTGVILGFAANAAKGGHHLFDAHLVAVIPVLSFPLSLGFYRHQLIMDFLGAYFRTDLQDFLRQDEIQAPRHWDNSGALHSKVGTFLTVEALAFTLILSVVPAACLIYLKQSSQAAIVGAWFWVGWCCTGVSFFVGVAKVVSGLIRWLRLRLRLRRTAHDKFREYTKNALSGAEKKVHAEH